MATAAFLAVAFLFQGTWALAGVTGGITGVVHDDTGAPVAGATVTASSPSQTATSTTDASGHFVFLVLQPDTYTLSVQKDGYQSVSIAGTTVLADQTQQVLVVTPRAIHVIATERTTASNLVKPGVGGDIYNVTPAQQQASAALGGGGDLNNAYSAIASVPGLYVPMGGAGWNQMVVIHGENPWTTGFEYDGVPVNRAFDQYNSSTESSLGLQELQVYTGGGPASIASSGISGFINQVIKTGTYPGYATFNGGIGTEAFYHQAQFEAGGATPDRNFSYYVGISGYNQAFRVIDQQNGASLYQPGGIFQFDSYNNLFQYIASADYGFGVTSPCVNTEGVGLSQNPASYDGNAKGACLMSSDPIGYAASFISDRENVVNLHFGIPRRDGQRDDFQLLWSSSSMKTYAYNSPNDQYGLGQMTLTSSLFPYSNNPNYNSWFQNAFGNGALCAPYCQNYPYYNDGIFYNLPFGTQVNNSAGTAPTHYQTYYFPASPSDRSFAGQLPANVEDNMWNDAGIVKLQWTHPFSDNAYMKIYGYSMFTDWNQIGANSSYEYFAGPIVPFANDYILITHTTGASVAFADQINDQNLVQLSANYVEANTARWYNTAMVSGAFSSPLECGNSFQACAPGSPIGLVSESGGQYTCYNPYVGGQPAIPCYSGAGHDTPYNNYTYGEPPITGAAATAGANYITLWNTDAKASYNSVTPHFYNVVLSEEFRPSDRLVVDLAGRYDNYNYVLPNSQTPANDFYAQIIQKYACYNPSTSTPLLTALGPGSPPPPGLQYTNGPCPTGYVHPDGIGSDPLFTDVSPRNYDISYWSARGSATYQSDPNTVWRFSAGRYVEPPLTAAVQYVNSSGDNRGQWGEFMLFGFLSPFHPLPAETSAQYDFSFEHHFAGSDVSVKITPFYHYSSNWQQQYFIGSGYVTQIPVGDFRSYGVEAALQAGDFARNGLSGMLTFTYTNAAVQYKSLLGSNIVGQLNTAIEAYNCYTSAYYGANAAKCNAAFPQLQSNGGACQYYANVPAPTGCSSAADPNAVLNPYYNASPQAYMDPNAWWSDPAQTGSGLYLGQGYNDAAGFAAPYEATLILNWRMNKFAITPSLQFLSGTSYGSPMDVSGVDPIACATTGNNQFNSGILTAPDTHACDYTTYGGGSVSTWGQLYVPNPQTGTFAHYGTYTEPSEIVANLQMSYDISPKVRLMLTAASLWHDCFGGSSEPWSKAYPAGQYVCGWNANSLNYVGGPPGGGAYVGSSPTDAAANGLAAPAWEQQSYLPTASVPGSFAGYLPFNVYIQAQIHL